MELYKFYTALILLSHNGVRQTLCGECFTDTRSALQNDILLVFHNCHKSVILAFGHIDLIQEGNIGLIKAVDKFDPTQGHRLTTLAFYWINKHIQRFLNHEPDELVSLDMEIYDGSETLLLSDTIEDKGTILGDPTIPHIDTVMEYEEMQSKIREMLSRLPEREQEVLRLLYGLDNYPVLSRREIAQVIGVREEQVSRIKTRALDALQGK